MPRSALVALLLCCALGLACAASVSAADAIDITESASVGEDAVVAFTHALALPKAGARRFGLRRPIDASSSPSVSTVAHERAMFDVSCDVLFACPSSIPLCGKVRVVRPCLLPSWLCRYSRLPPSRFVCVSPISACTS